MRFKSDFKLKFTYNFESIYLLFFYRNLARDKTGPLGIFYFGHSLNILSIASRLGIGKDDTPLMSTNFEQMKNRKWRTSILDPFAANVIAVFYRCRDGNKASILFNEVAMPINKDQRPFIPWETIEAQLEPIISNNETCNLNVCKNSAAEIVSISFIVITIFTFTQYAV